MDQFFLAFHLFNFSFCFHVEDNTELYPVDRHFGYALFLPAEHASAYLFILLLRDWNATLQVTSCFDVVTRLWNVRKTG